MNTLSVNGAEHGRLYWLGHNLTKRISLWTKQHKRLCAILLVINCILLFLLRAYLHPLAILVRKNIFIVAFLLPLGLVFYVIWNKSTSRKARLMTTVLGLVLLLGLGFGGKQIHNYLALYYRFRTLHVKEFPALPYSDNERVQPLNSIHSLAYEVMDESESPTRPDFVRIGTEYRWTFAIEPAYPISRLLQGVTEIFNLPGTTPSVAFLKEYRKPVHFEVGENLLLNRNSHSSTARTFGLWRFFNYEPADVIFLTDDHGNWVQVVSLIHWRGVFFPYPEFGGVQIIAQSNGGLINTLKRMFFGVGNWIKPEEVGKHQFLKGQGILSTTVSRYIANSFRFQNGFLAPLPGYHRGDIRIPDLPDDVNDQPFTTFFKRDDADPGMLYHYFALEPFDPEKQGLNTSLFIPADGSPEVYAYKHHQTTGSLTGVSAVSAKVMESKKTYDWSRSRPVEHRPFIHKINGVTKFFWLTTVVTFKEGEGSTRFIAGSTPDVVLTDAAYNKSVWVNALLPQTWIEQVKTELAPVWDPIQ